MSACRPSTLHLSCRRRIDYEHLGRTLCRRSRAFHHIEGPANFRQAVAMGHLTLLGWEKSAHASTGRIRPPSPAEASSVVLRVAIQPLCSTHGLVERPSGRWAQAYAAPSRSWPASPCRNSWPGGRRSRLQLRGLPRGLPPAPVAGLQWWPPCC